MPLNGQKIFKVHTVGNYTLAGKTLGKGNFARVELATHNVVKSQVALKIIDTDRIKEDYVYRNLEREAKILSKFDHPNIVKLYETLRCNSLYCLSLEYVQGGDLGNYIKSQADSRIPEAAARRLFFQLTSAVRHMHSQGILHRDLKLENVLLDCSEKIKLVDFGLSNFYDPRRPLRTHCGSPEYAAPELFMPKLPYGPAVDMWSLGVILFAMIVGSLPFRYPRKEANTVQERRRLLLEKISKGLGKIHRDAMKHLSAECRQLVHKLLEPDQSQRITLRGLLSHPWFRSDPRLPGLVARMPPSISAQLHPVVLTRLSNLISVPRKIIENRVSEKVYDKLYSMYHLMLDSMVNEKLNKSSKLLEHRAPNNMESTDSKQNFVSPRIFQKQSNMSQEVFDGGGSIKSLDKVSEVLVNSTASCTPSRDSSAYDMVLSKILNLGAMFTSNKISSDGQLQESYGSLSKACPEMAKVVGDGQQRSREQLQANEEPKIRKVTTPEKRPATPASGMSSAFSISAMADRAERQSLEAHRSAFRLSHSLLKLKEEFYREDMRAQECLGNRVPKSPKEVTTTITSAVPSRKPSFVGSSKKPNAVMSKHALKNSSASFNYLGAKDSSQFLSQADSAITCGSNLVASRVSTPTETSSICMGSSRALRAVKTHASMLSDTASKTNISCTFHQENQRDASPIQSSRKLADSPTSEAYITSPRTFQRQTVDSKTGLGLRSQISTSSSVSSRLFGKRAPVSGISNFAPSSSSSFHRSMLQEPVRSQSQAVRSASGPSGYPLRTLGLRKDEHRVQQNKMASVVAACGPLVVSQSKTRKADPVVFMASGYRKHRKPSPHHLSFSECPSIKSPKHSIGTKTLQANASSDPASGAIPRQNNDGKEAPCVYTRPVVHRRRLGSPYPNLFDFRLLRWLWMWVIFQNGFCMLWTWMINLHTIIILQHLRALVIFLFRASG